MSTAALLSVEDLSVEFRTRRGTARVLDRVGLAIERGQTLGVVGESGCGKSVTALAILRLIASPPGRITGGRVVFDGRDLLTLSEDEMRQVRGNRISMIFQEPMRRRTTHFRSSGRCCWPARPKHWRIHPPLPDRRSGGG